MVMALSLAAEVAYGRPAAQPRPRLAVAITNDAHLSLDVLGQVIRASTRVFAVMGVDIEWAMQGLPPEWTGTNDVVKASTVVHALIVSRTSPTTPHGEQLGATYPDTGAGASAVVLFNDAIALKADVCGVSHATLLTLALIHELGHVLLPAPAHEPAGIMMPVWDTVSIVDATTSLRWFTNEQGSLIRRHLIDRANVLGADPTRVPRAQRAKR
jgi:hypothetical protein